MFCHRSPTDSLLVTLGRWLDCSVPHMPNRYRLAQAAGPAGDDLPWHEGDRRYGCLKWEEYPVN